VNVDFSLNTMASQAFYAVGSSLVKHVMLRRDCGVRNSTTIFYLYCKPPLFNHILPFNMRIINYQPPGYNASMATATPSPAPFRTDEPAQPPGYNVSMATATPPPAPFRTDEPAEFTHQVASSSSIDPALLALDNNPSVPPANQSCPPSAKPIYAHHAAVPSPQPPDDPPPQPSHMPSSQPSRASSPQPSSRSVSPDTSAPGRNALDSNNHSWAARNPTRRVLESRPAPARLNDAQKASRKIAHEQKKMAAKELDDAIKAFTQDQHARIEELAKAHNVKVEKVKDLVGVYTHYRKSRKLNLWNAILHVKATEMNQGMPS